MTRREFSREKYNEKSSKIVKDIEIKEEDITFKSKYAPMIVAEFTETQIYKYCKDLNIENIYLYTNETSISDEGEVFENINVAKEAIKYTYAMDQQKAISGGLDGSGVVIGVAETDGIVQSNPEINESSVDNVDGARLYKDGSHITNVTRLIVGANSGFAPNAFVITGNSDEEHIEELIDRGVQIINMSFSLDTGTVYYSDKCKFYDHVVSYDHVTFVAAVCNQSREGKIFAPALSYNVIGVGAYYMGEDEDTFTLETSDDRMTEYSGFVNTGCAEKPDVVMPGTATSYATPVLTSCIALMLQLKPSLAAYPQAVKAIVLASCHDKVLSSINGEPTESIHSGITEKQGAGAFDLWSMFCIVSQGTYGVGRLSSARNQAVRRFVVPKYKSDYMNVSLTWIKENDVKEANLDHSIDNIDDGPYVNLDLYIYRNGQEVGSSTIGTADTKKSSTEMAYIALDDTNYDYEIRIKDVDSYNGVIRYGYAYSTNEPYITPATEEGIYYIRNYYSDKYLTLNASTNETFMSDFTGANNQLWILKGTENDYEIYPAHYSASQKINFGSQVGSNPYYKSVLGTSDLNLTLKSWETDTTLEPDAYVFTSTSGGSNNIMSYTSSTGIFVRSATESVINMYRMWVLEDINYQNGDVDKNGSITEDDIKPIQEYLSRTAALSNIQLYLSDANYDGKVSVQDVTYINKMIKGLL
ncbi:MAG: S8 family serine peptidase [Ruminococcus sp.]|nr:S8 family serine peptidase [Ruminococcus sp.]